MMTGPFAIAPVLPRPTWMRIARVPVLCVLVPLRMVGFAFVYALLALVCAAIRTTRLSAHKQQHYTRVCFMWGMRTLRALLGVRVRYRYAGIKTDEERGGLPRAVVPRIDTGGLIVANHIGLLDDLVIMAAYGCSAVAKDELRSVPLLGYVGSCMSNIFVKRGSAEDRQRVKDEIAARALNKQMPACIIHCEGTATSGRHMLQFQKGAFTSGAPVRPVAVELHYVYASPAWERGSLPRHFFDLCSSIYHDVTLHVWDEYTPSSAEVADPILYATNVRNLIAAQIRAEPSPLSMFDHPQLKASLAKRAKVGVETSTYVAAPGSSDNVHQD